MKKQVLSRIFWAKDKHQGRLCLKYSYLFDSSNEIRKAATIVIGSKAARMGDQPQPRFQRTNAASKRRKRRLQPSCADGRKAIVEKQIRIELEWYF